MKKEILHVNNLSVHYDETIAIKDVNISIFTGEIVALVGHNGAGKSSLLNCIAGIQTPTMGSVEFDREFIEPRLFATIGFSPQSQVMDWYTTVWDNVFLGSQLAGVDSKKGRILTEKALELLNILELKDKPVDALSGGQQQRVQIARAIVHQPEFYLLDEPTTGLDAETSDRLLSFLKEEAEQGKAVCVSSHDLHLLEEFCDKLILLDQGGVLYEGDLKKFLIENTPEKSYIIMVDRHINQIIIDELGKKGIVLTEIEAFQYRVVLYDGNEVTKLFSNTKEHFIIKEIEKETMSLRDLYIYHRKGGLNSESGSI